MKISNVQGTFTVGMLIIEMTVLYVGHNVQDKTLFIKKIQNQTSLQKKFEDKSKKEQTTSIFLLYAKLYL
jgi:hypothetical protein